MKSIPIIPGYIFPFPFFILSSKNNDLETLLDSFSHSEQPSSFEELFYESMKK